MSTGPTITVPWHLFDQILAGFLSFEAHQSLKSQSHEDPSAPFHPGDPFGDAVSWLWTNGQEERAVGLVADYLAQVRKWDELAITEPPRRVTLERMLSGLGFALPPNGLAGEQRMALMARLRQDVPKQFSSSLDD